MTKLSIITLNGLTLSIDDRLVQQELSQKSIGLLIYLTLSRHGRCKRESLASLFWDNSSLKSGRNNLRHVLWEINRISEKNNIVIGDQSTCFINPEIEVYVDAMELDTLFQNYQNMAIEGLKKQIEIYQNEFLENEYFNNATEINDWILISRNHYQKIHFEMIAYIGDQLLEQKAYEDSLQYYLKLLLINPLHEEAYHKIIHNRLLAGRRVEAIKYYQDFENILRVELNIEPGIELQNLYQQLIGDKKNEIKTDVKQYSLNRKKIKIDGTAFIQYELCSRILEALLSVLSMTYFSEDEKYKLAFLSYIYPDRKLMEIFHPQSSYKPSEMQIYHGFLVLFSHLCHTKEIQVVILNFNDADDQSINIVRAIDYHLKLQKNQVLYLS